MSEKKRGGLDYTPRAFPGARDPDGPAPGLEDQLAQMGLLEHTETKESRSVASTGANLGAKKRSGLEYTPQAFPGARAPDGPAPGLEERLVQMGLAERAEPRTAQPAARHDISYAPTQPPERRERPAPSPPPMQRERVAAPTTQARSLPPVSNPSPPIAARERIAAPQAPNSASIPQAEAPRRDERMAPQEPELPRRTERVEPSHEPIAPPPALQAIPQPVYIVPPPGAAATDQTVESLPPARTATSPLPPVPPEAAPRPLHSISKPNKPASDHDISSTAKNAPKPANRAARSVERLRKLPSKEERCRLSVRLVASVDDKLNDLAHLRGLDRNTAVSVAIVQDWVKCFGLQSGQ